MKRNYYTIEKYKQSFDAEGNEILTPINVVEGQRKLEVENALNASLPCSIYSSASHIDRDFDDEGELVFTDYYIAVTPYKMPSMGHYYSSYDRRWSNDATTDDLSVGIIGTRFTGEEDSVRAGTDTEVHTMRCRFSPPATTQRQINTLYLGAMRQYHSSYNTPFFSSVVLDTTCYQETDEVLIITYRYVYERLEIINQTPWASNYPEFANYVAGRLGMFSSSGLPIGRPYYMQFSSNKGVESGQFITGDAKARSSINNPYLDYGTDLFSENAFQVSVSLTVNDYVGKFLSAYTIHNTQGFLGTYMNDSNRDYTSPLADIVLRRGTDSCIQNTFNKVLSTADAESSVSSPFYSASAAGASIGTLTVADDLSSGDTSYKTKGNFADLIRIEITSGGAGGAAEYSVSRRVLNSFNSAADWTSEFGNWLLSGNYRNDQSSPRIHDISLRRVSYGLVESLSQTASKLIMPLEMGEVLIYCKHENLSDDGIFIHCLDKSKTGYPFKVDAEGLPTFTATDIRGVTTAEDGTIFVACADTGLWKLTRNYGDSVGGMTATLVSSTGATDDTSCIAVNFARYGNRFNSDARLLALFGDELCVSDDGGTTWTMYNAGTTPAFTPGYTPSQVVGICGHPDHLEAIIITHPNPFTYSAAGSYAGTSTKLSGYHWKGVDGTTIFVPENLFGDSCGAAQMYGGANAICRALTNAGTYKWTLHYRSGIYKGGVIVFNDLDSGTTLINSSSYGGSFELIYDEVNDDSYIIHYLSTSGYPIVAELSENLVSGSRVNDIVIDANNDYNAFILVGRGVFLGSGGINYPDTAFDMRVTGEYRCMFGNFRPFHFALSTQGNKDFYSDNRLNLWYKYGWSNGEWVLDGTGSKVSSVLKEELIEGLNITFTNDVSLPSDPSNFNLGECWDVYAYDGIVKDDYTSFTLEGLMYTGVSEIGSDFTPSIVPANGGGTNHRFPISVEYWGGHESITSFQGSSIFFGADFVTQAALGNSFGSLNESENLTAIGPETGASTNFTYEFKVSPTIINDVYVSSSSSNYTVATVRLMDFDSASSGSPGSTVVGIRPYVDISAPSSLFLRIMTETTQPASVEVTDWNAKNDAFYIVRDTTEETFELRRNAEVLYSWSYTDYADVNMRMYYFGYGSLPVSDYSSSTYGYGTHLWDMYLTLENDTRLISKIGNGTDTGAWADNYGRVAPLEWTRGIKKIYLDGIEASILYDNVSQEPAAGEVRIIPSTGELIFNPTDAGKVITGEWRYLPRVNKKA